jgi:hypothetical protein
LFRQHVLTGLSGSTPVYPAFLYTKLPKATYQNLVPGIQGSIDDCRQGFIAEIDRNLKRIHTFSFENRDLTLQNDGGQAKKIDRLSWSTNQVPEI